MNPRGVQLWLGRGGQDHVVDTLVMSNLGYFQLKAGPGLWQLRLAPGRSEELYTIASATGLSGSASEEVRYLLVQRGRYMLPSCTATFEAVQLRAAHVVR